MMRRANMAILVGAILAAGSAVHAKTGVQTSAHSDLETDRRNSQAASGGNATVSNSSAQPGGNSALGNGTAIDAELNSGIDSKKGKIGDPVAAHITGDVKADGKTVLPKGTKLLGHLTQVSAQGDSISSLAIQFDKAVLKNGQEVPLKVSIQAIAAEPRGASPSGPDLNGIAGSGSAAQAGSPMGAGRSQGSGAASAGTVAGEPSSVPDRTAGAVGGLNAAGQLSANSRGVFNLDGVNLSTDASSGEPGSLITSSGKSVHLDSGTRLLLVSQAEVSATPDK